MIVMSNVDFSLTENAGRKKREKGSFRGRERKGHFGRERERERRKMGALRCLCDKKIRV
jgi:hypothetical protein